MCFVNHHHLHSFIHSTYAHTLYISLSQYIYHLYMNIKELMKKTKRNFLDQYHHVSHNNNGNLSLFHSVKQNKTKKY